MILSNSRKKLLAFLFGILIAVLFGYVLTKEGSPLHGQHTHEGTHPVGTSTGDDVHVHADFQMYVRDERIRFTAAKYQSDNLNIRHADIHFHDGNDDVIHRHADGITLVEFFKSLEIMITNDCLTLDTGVAYCTNDAEKLIFYVNGVVTPSIVDYVIAEEDRVLLYYGIPENKNLNSYKNAVTDEACLYSGTCPERGTPPTEGCGLTCEVADFADKPTWWQFWK